MREIRTHIERPVFTANLVAASTAATSTGSPEVISPQLPYRTFFAMLTTGTSASVDIEVSGNGVQWLKFATLTPTTTPDGYADICPWPYVRAVVTANNGTLTVTVGC